MIRYIADELADLLLALNFVDKAGGVVTTLRKQVKTENGMEWKLFPACPNSTKGVCLPDDYVDYVPDSSLKGLTYFEAGVLTQDAEHVLYNLYSQPLKLIGWFNLKLINQTYLDAGLLKAKIIETIPMTLDALPTGDEFINRIRIVGAGEDAKSATIFGNYTYEDKKQYLMYPFDYFALNYTVHFAMSKQCVPEITLNPDSC